MVASKRFTNDVNAFKKIINRSLVGINVVLYAIFVALVLAFQFAKSTSDSPCSGRQEADDNSSELKQNISIAYGMIIAGISLIIGVLFVVFGIRIRTFISMSQSHDKVNISVSISPDSIKIFIVTAICSVCFILHSAFIVVVSFLSTPNLLFSFVGLVITEWFPAIFILTWLFVRRASSLSSSRDKGTTTIGGIRSGSINRSTPYNTTKSSNTKTESIQVELSAIDVDSHS